MKFKFRFPYFILFVLLILALDACQKQLPNNNVIKIQTIKVETVVTDSSATPVIIGGIVSSSNNDSIYEKGVIVGIDSNLSLESKTRLNFNYTPVFSPPVDYAPVLNLTTGGWDTTSLTSGYIKSSTGLGGFTINLLGTKGATVYLVRAYAISGTDTVYGKIKSFTTANYKRQMNTKLSHANVFWNSNHTLFDLLTDEVITPDVNGVYNFWYSSFEDINVYATSKTSAQLSGFLYFKFKSRANCQTWCDLASGRVLPQ